MSVVKKTLYLLGVAAAIAVVGMIGYQTLPREETAETPFLVGAPFILSGSSAAWGENAQQGLDIAVEEINNQGGINGRTIQVVYEDTAAEAKQAVSAYQKLITTGKVDALIGPLFQVELTAIAPLIARDNFPIIAPSYLPIENRPVAHNPLLIWMDPIIEVSRLAEYIRQQGINTISIVSTQDSWERDVANGFADAFTALGGKVVYQELLQPDATDVRTSVTKAIAPKPDAIFVGSYLQFISITKAIKELGYAGPLYGIEVDAYLASETKSFSDGMRFIAPDFYTKAFIEKFKDKYGQEPGIPAGQTYDAMYILASLAKKAESKKELIETMAKFKNYQGVSGKIEVTDDNKTILPTAIFAIQNGEIVRISAK